MNRGWFGAFADKLQAGASDSQLPMNVSMTGSNVMQDGLDRTSYAITDKGSVGMVFKDSESASDMTMQYFNQLVEAGVDSILSRSYKDPFKQTYASFTRQAQKHHETFSRATRDIRVRTTFSDKKLFRDLKMVARTIKAADRLGMPQQTFFLRYIGWDHHDELLKNHERKLKIVSQAMSEFQQALEELNVADQVITFTGSDFGRSLTSNGNGTDHGWGGNTMIMGENIHGGQVLGEYPSLALGGELEVSDGILIPSTSTGQLYAELAMWFGLKKQDLPKLFPNIENFYSLSSDTSPLGAVKL
ncbi:MAG: DUF1501 domain-containing protein [Endozoicomonas sp.]|uniref:DUF1501 domain-containing protein n=1 Tax=Endozoicomonas sp. TaxID=1892382 RepID=UPI003D9B9E7A